MENEIKPPPPASKAKRAIVGYRTGRDVKLATHGGMLRVKAHHPITDTITIALLKLAKVKLEPIYAED